MSTVSTGPLANPCTYGQQLYTNVIYRGIRRNYRHQRLCTESYGRYIRFLVYFYRKVAQ